ncbi:MAG TPA: molybdenum cofactor guanylyltransferase [Bacteroidota bacterium]|nr:molybdenum cofactor guanylyltransferase [Bacteroidota bacterium]
MSSPTSIIGAVLTGGKSSRMGTDKALLPFRDRPLVQGAVETLRQVFSTVVLVGGDRNAYELHGVNFLPDIFSDCGPLAGIHAALTYARPHPVYVLACDTPFVSSEVVQHILDAEKSDRTRVAVFEDVLQPLCGLYNTSCLELVETDLRHGRYSVRRFLEAIDCVRVPISTSLPFVTPNTFLNINRPEDYRSIGGIEPGGTNG